MSCFYNEWHPPTARWLSELATQKEIPAGVVNTSSITDLNAEEIKDYDQCHFFAGIGGWPLALRWSGLEGVPGIWTGSPPCQPFSEAGQRKGQQDERHLAPVWLDLIKKCRPSIIFGEQVAAAIRYGWLDDLLSALEAEGYACGAAVLPACSVGAPHRRNRLFFGAFRLANLHGDGCQTGGEIQPTREKQDAQHDGAACELADLPGARWGQAGCAPTVYREADGEGAGNRGSDGRADGVGAWVGVAPGGSADHGIWSDADWLACRDGKFRPVEPGSFPLAHGLPSRVGRLRGYGNALVPQVAATFCEAFIEAAQHTLEIKRRQG